MSGAAHPARLAGPARSAGPDGGRATTSAAERGQATVELAVALPLLFAVLLAAVQMALVVRDQLFVIHAAREAARVAAIEGDDTQAAAAARAATGLAAERLELDVAHGDGMVVATVVYRSPIVVPLLSAAWPDVTVTATITMFDERAALDGRAA